MPTPGIDAHIVIDGQGYISADLPDYAQESRIGALTESLAPTFGDYANSLDPMASDLTMLLPIGQATFTDGIGATDLEKSPLGYERGENLIVTPQGSLINGPLIQTEQFTASAAPTATEGYFGGTIASGLPNNYFGIGTKLYSSINGVYSDRTDAGAAIKHIGGYAGKAIISLGDGGILIYSGITPTAGMFYSHRFFTLNGFPFILYKDGRVYAAYLSRPSAIAATNEVGAIATVRNWMYVIQYVLPGTPDLVTEFSPPFAITKLANQQTRLTLPVKGYRGGDVKRRLFRTKDNDMSNLYRIADESSISSLLTSYADAVDDGALGATTWDWTVVNNTAINVLTRGTTNNNMSYPDTDPLFLPESVNTPSTGSIVNATEVFHDLQGNEALLVGCTNGLFIWNGVVRTFQTLRLFPYHSLNFKYMAVNHDFLYYTLYGHEVRLWNDTSESILNGPWLTHFSTINEIRLCSGSHFIFIGVSGINKYDGSQCLIIYAFDGKSFVWSYRVNSAGAIYPVMGNYVGRNDLLWYEASLGLQTIKYITLNPNYTNYQTSGVLFRSAVTDLDLPRLRKQIFGCMVRYQQLTAQTSTTLAVNSNVGDTTIQVASATGLSVGDWISIKESILDYTEYRKIANIVGTTITLTHVLGGTLLYPHLSGIAIKKCGAVATIRNVFTDALPNQDIEIGGPADSTELFCLIKLPTPIYTYSDGFNLVWNTGTVMELQGWALITSLNPPYNGLIDANLRLQDSVKLPNSQRDSKTAAQRKIDLVAAYNKGTVTVIDPTNVTRLMRFQRLSFNYEEPKERHGSALNSQATAHVRLIDVGAELMKQETLTLQGLSGNLAQTQAR